MVFAVKTKQETQSLSKTENKYVECGGRSILLSPYLFKTIESSQSVLSIFLAFTQEESTGSLIQNE